MSLPVMYRGRPAEKVRAAGRARAEKFLRAGFRKKLEKICYKMISAWWVSCVY